MDAERNTPGMKWIMNVGELVLGQLELLSEHPLKQFDNCNGLLDWLDSNVLLHFVEQRKELSDQRHDTAREVIFSVLGKDFVNKYHKQLGLAHPNAHHPELLYEPYMNGLVRRELQDEYKKELEEYLWSRLQQLKGADSDPVLQSYTEEVRFFVKKRLEAWDDLNSYSSHQRHEWVARALKSALQGQGYNVGSCLPHGKRFMLGEADRLKMFQKELFHFEFFQPEDSRWHSFHSELQEQVGGKLRGRSLPLSLFRMLLLSQLFSQNETVFFREAMVNFTRIRASSTTGLSNIHGMLRQMITKAFGTDLKLYDDPFGLVREQVLKILNAYYIYQGGHSSSLAYLATPLVTFFTDLEVPIEVYVQMIHTLKKTLHWVQDNKSCEAQAKEAFQQFAKQSPTMAKHIICLYTDFRTKMSHALVGASVSQVLKIQRTVPHMIFVPWLRQGLVGVLSKNALQFVWGQCLLFGWDQLTQFAVDTLNLLDETILKCASYEDLHLHLEESTTRLKTCNLRKSFAKRMGLKELIRARGESQGSQTAKGKAILSKEQSLIRETSRGKAIAHVGELLLHTNSNTANLIASIDQLTEVFHLSPETIFIPCPSITVESLKPTKSSQANDSSSPLIGLAARNWYPRIVELLLQKGNPVNQPDPAWGKSSPLISALASMFLVSRREVSLDPSLPRRLVYTLRVLLHCTTSTLNLNYQTRHSILLQRPSSGSGLVVPSGSTALHVAVLCAVHANSTVFEFGHPMVLEMLLRAGASRSVPDSNGSIPADLLQQAHGHESFPAVATMLAGTFDGKGFGLANDVLAACKKGDSKLLRNALDEVTASDPAYRWVVYTVHGSVSSVQHQGGRSTLVSPPKRKQLLVASSQRNVQLHSGGVSSYLTPLGIACREGHWEIVKMLFNFGVAVTVCGPCRQDALFIARVCRARALELQKHYKITNPKELTGERRKPKEIGGEEGGRLEGSTSSKNGENQSKGNKGTQGSKKSSKSADDSTKNDEKEVKSIKSADDSTKNDEKEAKSNKSANDSTENDEKETKSNTSANDSTKNDEKEAKSNKSANDSTKNHETQSKIKKIADESKSDENPSNAGNETVRNNTQGEASIHAFDQIILLMEREYETLARTSKVPLRSFCYDRLGRRNASQGYLKSG